MNKDNLLAMSSKERVKIVNELLKKEDFFIDKRIFDTSSKISTKNFRISDDLYNQFVKVCQQKFPHLKIQDILSQLIFNFVNRYS